MQCLQASNGHSTRYDFVKHQNSTNFSRLGLGCFDEFNVSRETTRRPLHQFQEDARHDHVKCFDIVVRSNDEVMRCIDAICGHLTILAEGVQSSMVSSLGHNYGVPLRLALTSARAVRFASVPELENRSSRYWGNESKIALPDDLQTCLLLPDQIRYRGRNAWPW